MIHFYTKDCCFFFKLYWILTYALRVYLIEIASKKELLEIKRAQIVTLFAEGRWND